MDKIDKIDNKTEPEETLPTESAEQPPIKDATEPTEPTETIYHKSTIFNCVLSFFNKYLKHIDLRKCYLYHFMHYVFICFIMVVFIFNTNLIHLTILLTIITLDAISIVVLHECPLSVLERNHSGIALADIRSEMFKHSGIGYDCTHEYEKQMEIITNACTMVATKILFIITLKTFNIKLINYHNLYQ
jgi:hypothetical protein